MFIPLDNLVALLNDALSINLRYLLLNFTLLDRALHAKAVRLEIGLSGDSLPLFFVLGVISFRFVHHSLDVFPAEASLVIGNRYFVLLVRRLLHRGDI